MTAAERITRAEARQRFDNAETIGYAYSPSARELDAWITPSYDQFPSFGYLARSLDDQNTARAERGLARRVAYWYRPVERAPDDMQREAVDAIRVIVSTRGRSTSPTLTLARVQAVLARLTEQENHQ